MRATLSLALTGIGIYVVAIGVMAAGLAGALVARTLRRKVGR